MADQQTAAKRVTTTGTAAEVELDLLDYPAPTIEVYGETDVNTDLIIEGSINKVDWREKQRQAVVGAGLLTAQLTLPNAYRYIRARFADPGNQVLEVAAGGR